MTYGADHEEIKEKAREMNDLVNNSRTWINTSPSKIPKFQVVTRRAPNLKDNLFKRKRLTLGYGSNLQILTSNQMIRKRDGHV